MFVTRMHSSRMRATRSSSRLLGGVCLSVGLETLPGVGLEIPPGVSLDPPGCGPGDPPQARPLNFPPGCGPGDLQGMLGYHPPPTPWKPARHAGIPPPP